MHKKSDEKCKGEHGMDAAVAPFVERYCSISESLKESCSQVKLMREGKLLKKSWKDFREELKKNKSEDE